MHKYFCSISATPFYYRSTAAPLLLHCRSTAAPQLLQWSGSGAVTAMEQKYLCINIYEYGINIYVLRINIAIFMHKYLCNIYEFESPVGYDDKKDMK